MSSRSIPLFLGLAFLTTTFGWSQNSKDAERAIFDVSQKSKLAGVSLTGELIWKSLAEGVHVYSNSERYQWKNIPAELHNTRFLSLPIHKGVLEFEVASDGLVFIITSTRWGGGGNSGGDWQESVMVEKDLRREGWRQLRKVKNLTATDPGEMAVFWRHSKRGEKHSIRTEKYVAPMLLIR